MNENTTTEQRFTDEERAAMKERASEVKAARRGTRAKADAEGEVLAKIAEMTDADRVIAERLHAVVKSNAPQFTPRLWYGMPAYARNGKIVCFFQPAAKFKSRYATLGFNDEARLDDGTMWPTSFALTAMDAAAEERIGAIITQAVS
ncbi:DUF1801 domain-containing protein [Actinoplanes sp. NPDC024001]|uniref:iron chaperone n=1 Tax=Actinoplanes sp. NPDC024001 TaxID=3154598 RepID=UPI0033CF98DB